MFFAVLFVFIIWVNREMIFVDICLIFVLFVVIVGCFFFFWFGCYKFFKCIYVEAVVCVLIVGLFIIGFLGFVVFDFIYGDFVLIGLVVVIIFIIVNVIIIFIGLYLLNFFLGVDGKKNSNLSVLIFAVKELVVWVFVLVMILVLVGVKILAVWDLIFNLIVKVNLGVVVFAVGLILAVYKFEFSVEIVYNIFLKLILMLLVLFFVGMVCYLNSEYL